MEKVVFYPVTSKELPIIMLNKQFKSCRDIIPVVEKAYNLRNNNLCVLDSREGEHQYKDLNLNEVCKTSDFIYLLDSFFNKERPDSQINEFIGKYGEKVKTSIRNLHNICQENNNSLKWQSLCEPVLKTMEKEKFLHEKMYEPDIPIIMVGGLIGPCNQKEIAARISFELNNRGYKSSAVISDPDYEVLGCYSYPSVFFDHEYSDEYKIKLFNNYIKNIIQTNQSEILVIEVPEDLMRFSNKYAVKFGTEAFMISQAVVPDKFVLCMNCEEYEYKNYQNIFEYLIRKFDFDTSFVHVSNTVLDYESLELNNILKYYYTSKDVANTLRDKTIGMLKEQSSEISLGNLLDDAEMQSYINYLIKSLTTS